ncbi:AAA family ATPase [Achromobacter xylosoxidans]
MKLSRIVLEEFRKFRQPLALDGLQPGLNLFVGPNEAGKSTVARHPRRLPRTLQHQDGRRSGAARRIRRAAQCGAGVQPRGTRLRAEKAVPD